MFFFKCMGVTETFIMDQQGIIRETVIGAPDWTRLDSLQVQTKLFNITAKVADVQQSDRRARKG